MTPPARDKREHPSQNPATPEAAAPEPRFETLVAELDTIVARLERGEIALEAALEAFERGSALAQQAGALLDRAEARLAVLTEARHPPREGADGGRPRETPLAFPSRDDEASE